VGRQICSMLVRSLPGSLWILSVLSLPMLIRALAQLCHELPAIIREVTRFYAVYKRYNIRAKEKRHHDK
jgi:hypothetical protein